MPEQLSALLSRLKANLAMLMIVLGAAMIAAGLFVLLKAYI
jgi:hypothetical protein